MGDEIQRQALARDLARRQQILALDELRVLDRVQQRLELGRQRYGVLDLAAPRDWRAERFEEELDALVYQVCGELAAEDLARASLREAARAEMVGGAIALPGEALREWRNREAQSTRVTDESARIAAGDIDGDDPYEEWRVGDSEGGAG